MANNPEALYIHIPFCDHICKYCDFTKLFYSQNLENDYLNSLIKEISTLVTNKVSTLYFGGGTPTALSDAGFDKILSFTSDFLTDNYEFTVEANVENLTENKLKIMKQYGVNRLSIGVQSTNDKLLKEIGRNHTFEDAKNAINLAKEFGFNNINIDLIYGFKNETLDDLKKDLDEFIKLDIDHISIYSLIVEKGSILYNEKYPSQDEENSRIFYEYIVKFLRENGYDRYEISNFARNKKYSRHNLTYWHNEEYYGCGLGASGYINGIRYQNTKSLPIYNLGNYISSKEEVTDESYLEYFLLTNLRLENGFSRTIFKDAFGSDFYDMFNEKILKYSLQKYFTISDSKIALNDEGLIMMDFVLYKLL